MGQIVKTYLGIFLMMLLTVVGIGIVSAEMEIGKARNYKTDVAIELENSDYNPGVIAACIKQAKEMGYELKITLYEEDGQIQTAEADKTNVTAEDVVMAELLLRYPYRISPFHKMEWHSIQGMAR